MIHKGRIPLKETFFLSLMSSIWKWEKILKQKEEEKEKNPKEKKIENEEIGLQAKNCNELWLYEDEHHEVVIIAHIRNMILLCILFLPFSYPVITKWIKIDPPAGKWGHFLIV